MDYDVYMCSGYEASNPVCSSKENCDDRNGAKARRIDSVCTCVHMYVDIKQLQFQAWNILRRQQKELLHRMNCCGRTNSNKPSMNNYILQVSHFLHLIFKAV